MGLRFQIQNILRHQAQFAGHYTLIDAEAPNKTIVTLGNLTNKSWTIAAQPCYPVNMLVLVVDTTPGIVAGIVTITGKGAYGQTLVETLNCAAGAGTYTGTKAFSVITTIVTSGFTVLGGSGDETFHVHTGTAIGLPCYKLKAVYAAFVDRASDTVGTVNTTYGTIVPNTAPNASRDLEFYYTYYPMNQAY
jgi:hypothetical protein